MRRVIVVAAALALLVTAAARGAEFTPGSAGVGDPFFPDQGNGGYDVAAYDLDLAYRPDSKQLRATARITADATQDLSRFDLDYRGPKIESLSVGGTPASFSRHGQELVVTPPAGIVSGTRFLVEVHYHGVARNIKDPDGSPDGWIHTDDGVAALGEPQGAPTWFPCNDTPLDKALYRISIRVPKRLKAISNGRLASHDQDGTWNWVTEEPMASYLATVTVGRFQVDRGRAAGVPSYVAVDPREARESKRPLRAIPGILRLFDRLFGPYPFSPGRSDRRARRPRDRLCARDPDPAGLRHSSERAADRARARSPMVRRQRQRHPPGPTSGSTRALRPGPSGATRNRSATPPRRTA